MEKRAERMLEDPSWVLRYLWLKRTGSPPLAFEEFRPAELSAFLLGMDQHLDDNPAAGGLSPKRWGPPRRIKLPSSWDEAIKTGDPLIDRWEEEIAAGRTPDLTEGLQ